MGCRIKENPDKIFDWFFEVAIPKSSDDDPKVVRQFPEEFDDQDSIEKFPKFCFPFDIDRVKESTVVQNFTFVLTDFDGNQRFGFCRISVGYKTCICILSYLPWFEIFYKLLNNIADHLAKDQLTDLGELLTSLYRHPVPQLNSAVSLEFDQKFTKLSITTRRRHRDTSKDPRGGNESLSYFIAPDSGGLPTIPESRNLTEFVLAVDVNNMLQLFASILHERRILITSSKLSTLTACVHASTAMLYPMYWQNIYIPILPPHLLDYCCAPMPYLIGVHSSLMEHVRQRPLEDVVVLNVDSNTLETPFQDLESLPADVVSLLKLRLKKQSAVTGDGVARAFLRAQVLLFGSYRDALICTPGEPITFCEESFLDHKSNPMKQFLQNAVHLQLFKEFIDGRLLKLNSGAGFSDVFEQEIDTCGLGTGNSKSYQLWVENLKKSGGALMHTVKNKTNPAMKNMYKKAKGQAKMGLKDLRIRLRQKDMTTNRLLQRGGSLRNDHFTDISQPRTAHDCLQNRLPITQHFGQSRPRRPSKINPLYEENSSWASQSDVSATMDDEPQPVEEMPEMDDHFLQGSEIDLLGEIFDTLSTQASSEKGLLYGTQSLNFFSLDDSSFIKTIKSLNPPSDDSLNFTSRRDSEPFGSGHWYSDRKPSLEHLLPSSDELSISEELEGVCTQEGQNVASCSLVVPLAATFPEWTCHNSKGSGMWDRGISEQDELDVRADESIDTPCQMMAQGLSRDFTKSQVEEGKGCSERNDKSEGCEQNPRSPNIKLQPEGIQETEEKANISSVLSSVAHLQTRAQQKAHSCAGDRGTAPLENLSPNNRLEVCEECLARLGGEEMESNGTSDHKPRDTDGSLSPSWKKKACKVNSTGLTKVSELKKIFEV